MKTTTKKTGAKTRKGKPGKTVQRKASTTARTSKAGKSMRKPPATKPDGQARSGTKQETIIAMLHSKAGATIPAIIKVTGWQPHSVRGFLSGHVKKKLGLDLTSAKHGDERVYRIAAAGRASRGKGKT